MQVLDVYYLSGTQELQPAIISIHGGGYSYGSKDVYQYYCMNLAQRGFTVVNFSYRLAPKYKFPSQLEDTNSVLSYVCEHAEELHIDTDNIFFVGDSAGGHLNFQYSTAVTDPEYAALLNLRIPDFTLRATALNCGVYSIEDTTELIHYYFDHAQYAEEMNIQKYVTDAFPPAFVMSATGDICLPYAEPLHEFLDETGIVNELHIYGDQMNKPPHVFHINIRNDMATLCNDDECAFFARYISK